MTETTRTPTHPVVWMILYAPFGALSGFTSVAQTFLANRQTVTGSPEECERLLGDS